MGTNDALPAPTTEQQMIERTLLAIRAGSQQRAELERAFTVEPGLRGDVAYMLAHLAADLSGPFLSNLIRRLADAAGPRELLVDSALLESLDAAPALIPEGSS